MDEVLNKLLQSELLSEDVKAEITTEWTSAVEAYKATLREQVSGDVRLELAEQWNTERDELVAKVDGLVSQVLVREMAELRGDIDRFRDLEVEYAEKLVEEKHRLAGEVASELDALVDKIDEFFEMRLEAEMSELREDLEVVKKNDAGMQMFEAFAETFGHLYADDASTQRRLSIAESKLADAETVIAEREKQLGKMIRESKMESVLSALTGKKREQMALLLKNVDTQRLEESYKYFIGRILREGTEETTASTIVEAQGKTTVVTGDKSTQIIESAQGTKTADNAELAAMKRLAGIK